MSPNFRKKILFLSHDSSLTGAPVLLINLLKLVRKSDGYDFEVLLYRGGALEKEFKKLAPTDILKGSQYSTEKNLINRFLNYIGYKQKLRQWRKKIKAFDVIFSNTIVNGSVLKAISGHNIPVISYVHELESVIRQYRKDALHTFQISDLVVVPSAAVGDNLASIHSIPEKKICRLDYFFPGSQSDTVHKIEARQRFLHKYNLPKNKFYVVSMGTATYRKGIDLFLEIAEELKYDPDIFLVWIGDFVDPDTKDRVYTRGKTLAPSGNVLITGFLPYSPLNLLPFDLFCLPSREDPYPLVMIEAAINKIPSLCFNSGGAGEFVSGGCGWLIDNFSAKAMADMIRELKNSKEKVEIAGNKAFNKAVSMHLNEERILHQFNTIVNKVSHDSKIHK